MSPSLVVLFTDERWLVRKGEGGPRSTITSSSLVTGIEGICHGLNNGRPIKGESRWTEQVEGN